MRIIPTRRTGGPGAPRACGRAPNLAVPSPAPVVPSEGRAGARKRARAGGLTSGPPRPQFRSAHPPAGRRQPQRSAREGAWAASPHRCALRSRPPERGLGAGPLREEGEGPRPNGVGRKSPLRQGDAASIAPFIENDMRPTDVKARPGPSSAASPSVARVRFVATGPLFPGHRLLHYGLS